MRGRGQVGGWPVEASMRRCSAIAPCTARCQPLPGCAGSTSLSRSSPGLFSFSATRLRTGVTGRVRAGQCRRVHGGLRTSCLAPRRSPRAAHGGPRHSRCHRHHYAQLKGRAKVNRRLSHLSMSSTSPRQGPRARAGMAAKAANPPSRSPPPPLSHSIVHVLHCHHVWQQLDGRAKVVREPLSTHLSM